MGFVPLFLIYTQWEGAHDKAAEADSLTHGPFKRSLLSQSQRTASLPETFDAIPPPSSQP